MLTKLFGFLSVASVFLTQTNAQSNDTIIIEEISENFPTATILGGVAVAISGIGVIGFVIHYLRKGGSVSGLAKIAYENREVIADNIHKLPLDDLKKYFENNKDIKKLEEYKKQAEELYNKLPDSIKDKIKDNLTAEHLIELVENPDKFQQKIKNNIISQSNNQSLSDQTKSVIEKLPISSDIKSNIINSTSDNIKIELKENLNNAPISTIIHEIQPSSINIIENSNEEIKTKKDPIIINNL